MSDEIIEPTPDPLPAELAKPAKRVRSYMPTNLDHGGARKCHAKNKQGVQCGKYAMKGVTVCRNHGGAAPNVKAAGIRRHREFLMSLVDPALLKIHEILHSKSKRMDPGVQFRAAIAVLDRCGFGPTATIDVTSGGDSLADQLKKAWPEWLKGAKQDGTLDAIDVPVIEVRRDE